MTIDTAKSRSLRKSEHNNFKRWLFKEYVNNFPRATPVHTDTNATIHTFRWYSTSSTIYGGHLNPDKKTPHTCYVMWDLTVYRTNGTPVSKYWKVDIILSNENWEYA